MAKQLRNQAAGKYLRVTTPRTTDGQTLMYGDDKKVVEEVTYLPASAKAELERNSNILPKHLHPKIEVIDRDVYEKEISELEDEAGVPDSDRTFQKKVAPAKSEKETDKK